MVAPETSVIVRVFNEIKHLPTLFDTLAQQSYRDFETIVVDSGSFDGSLEFARQHATHVIDISQDDFTFGHSLNVGIAAARGQFVAILSAHCEPTDVEWLHQLIAPLRDAQCAMVYGRQIGDVRSKASERHDFLRTFGAERKVLTPPHYFANNANSAVRQALWTTHRFDETLPGLEDVEWAKHFMEAGYHVVYEPAACVCHIHQETWPQLRRRYYREGQAAKWIGTHGRRHIPREIGRELIALLSDLGWATRQRPRRQAWREIFRFRYEKSRGMTAGIWDSSFMENPLKRRALYFPESYQAVVIHDSGRASLEQRDLPALRPGEVLIRVAYVGICRTDLEVLDGSLGYFKEGLSTYPIVPGHELSGTVAAVGARVTNVKVGTRVVIEPIQGCGRCAACEQGNGIACPQRAELGVMRRDGGYADFLITPARFVHPVPDALGLREAVLCEPAAVVVKGLARLERAMGPGVAAERRCIVIGAGTIGNLAARILQLRGYAVTIYDQDESRLASLQGLGVKTTTTLSEHLDAEAIVEATGAVETLEACLTRSPTGAAVLLLGFPYAVRPFSFESVVAYDRIIVGSVGSGPADFTAALEILAQLDLTAFQDGVYPLERFQDAWHALRGRQHLKVKLHVDSAA